MKIAISMVKNEQDIIEPFVRHTLRFFDYLVVLDNDSIDDTRRILDALAAELPNLVVVDDRVFGYFQAEKMTEAYRVCQAALAADYVMFLDADEFIGRVTPAEFDAMLSLIEPGGLGYLPWKNFVLKPGTLAGDGDGDPPATMFWRRAEETPWMWKVILRADGAFDPGLQVSRGNHNIVHADGRALPQRFFVDGALLHFPVRSASQLTSKAVVGWIAILSKARSPDETQQAMQWRSNYDRALSGEPLGEEELCLRSMQYDQHRPDVDWDRDVVEERHGIACERRYSSGRRLPPLALVSRSWEQAVIEASPLLRRADAPEDLRARIGRLAADRVGRR